jgi:hypothetical protein
MSHQSVRISAAFVKPAFIGVPPKLAGSNQTGNFTFGQLSTRSAFLMRCQTGIRTDIAGRRFFRLLFSVTMNSRKQMPCFTA